MFGIVLGFGFGLCLLTGIMTGLAVIFALGEGLFGQSILLALLSVLCFMACDVFWGWDNWV